MTAEAAVSVERGLLDEFGPAAEPHVGQLERRPAGVEEWWSVMQHYGLPTRVLDWTPDPWVAVWFAVREHDEADGVVWLFMPARVQQWMRRHYGTYRAPNPPGDKFYSYPRAPRQLFHGDILLRSPRSAAQKGQFGWCRREDADHGSIIHDCTKDTRDAALAYRRVVIPAELKAEVRASVEAEARRSPFMLFRSLARRQPECAAAVPEWRAREWRVW